MLTLFPTTPFEVLVAESARVGWPTSYRNDLLVYDRERLEKWNPPRFVWVLRELGTWLILPDSPGDAVILRCCEEDTGPPDRMRHRVYAYDERGLREVHWAEAWDLLCGWSTQAYRKFEYQLRRGRAHSSRFDLERVYADIEREKEGHGS